MSPTRMSLPWGIPIASHPDQPVGRIDTGALGAADLVPTPTPAPNPHATSSTRITGSEAEPRMHEDETVAVARRSNRGENDIARCPQPSSTISQLYGPPLADPGAIRNQRHRVPGDHRAWTDTTLAVPVR